MSSHTEALIRQLAERSAPVRPLARPSVRAALWLAIAVPAVALMTVVMHPRSDVVLKLATPRYLSEEAFALVTSVLAAVAAFASVVPGYNRKLLVLPVVPCALWLGGLAQGGVRDW